MIGRKIKVMVIGLDAATWDLIEPWVKEGKLPNFENLMKNGTYGVLKSTYPPVTPSAWASFLTGVNPGKHGIFGFTDASPDNPVSLGFPEISRSYMGISPIWDVLGDCGKRVCLVNIPFAFPPSPVNGVMTSGMRTPSVQSDFVYPGDLKKDLLEKFDFLPDYGEEVYKNREYFCEIHDKNLMEMQKMSLYLLNKESWDFYMFVPMEIDHAQHMFWADMDEHHPFHDSKSSEKYRNKIFEYYEKFDGYLGEIMGYMDNDTVLIVCSDHGAGPSYKRMALNAWLMKEGYLKLKENRGLGRVIKKIFFKAGLNNEKIKKILHKFGFSRYVTFSPAFLREVVPSKEPKMWNIDWARTKTYSNQTYGQVFINRSVVSGEGYDNVREEVTKKLYNMKDPGTGETIVGKVYKKEEIYWGPHVSRASDLFVTLRDETCEIIRFSENGDLFTSPYLSGKHKKNGIFLIYGKGIRSNFKMGNATIYDIAPSILHIMGIPIPKDMDGRVLNEIFKKDSELAKEPLIYREVSEKEEIKKKIKELKAVSRI